MMHKITRACLLTTTVLCCATGSPAFAQVAPVDRPGAESEREIVVTAQKRSERLIDVPTAVSVVSSDTLIEQNLLTLRDYFVRVPGLNYSESRTSVLSIRGITTGAGNPTVAITVDDVPFGSSVLYGQTHVPDFDPGDLERIEVLKGPQSTLYGANSLGGLIKYVARRPDTDDLSARAEIGAVTVHKGGSEWSGRAGVNVPLQTDVAALSISGFYRHDPGYTVNTTANRDEANRNRIYGGRIAFTLQPTDNFALDLSGMTQIADGLDEPFVNLRPDYSPRTGELDHVGGVVLDRRHRRFSVVTIRAEQSLGFGDLTSVTSYSEARAEASQDVTNAFAGVLALFGFAGQSALIENNSSTDKWTQELRLASKPGSRFEWLLGGFYTKEESQLPQAVSVVDRASGAFLANLVDGGSATDYREIAGFADITYHFTPTFDVQAGVRYAHNKQNFGGGTSTGLLVNPNAPVEVGQSSESAVTWLFTPRYKFSENVMAYFRVASGYRPGGPNTSSIAGIPPTFDSDRTVNYELGLKGTALDRRVEFDLSAYWIDWSDIQLVLADPRTNIGYLSNGGSARSRGFEATITTRPWTGMTLGGNLSLNEAELTDAINDPAVIAAKGERLPVSPKVTFNIDAQQDFTLGGTKVYIGGTVSHIGKRLAGLSTPSIVPRIVLEDFTTLDLRAGARLGRFNLSVYARNLTDERGYLSGQYTSPTIAAAGIRMLVNRPRSFGATLSAAF